MSEESGVHEGKVQRQAMRLGFRIRSVGDGLYDVLDENGNPIDFAGGTLDEVETWLSDWERELEEENTARVVPLSR